jgi:cytochrome c553
MKRIISVSALLVLIASPALMQTRVVAQADQHRTMLNTYCVTCHNDRAKTGGSLAGWGEPSGSGR